jgi:hypothetical protein
MAPSIDPKSLALIASAEAGENIEGAVGIEAEALAINAAFRGVWWWEKDFSTGTRLSPCEGVVGASSSRASFRFGHLSTPLRPWGTQPAPSNRMYNSLPLYTGETRR